VDTARDLAGADPWRESLERSRARRRKSRRPRAADWRSRLPSLSAKGLPALPLLLVILATVLAGGGPQASPTAAHADMTRVATGLLQVGSPFGPRGPAGSGAAGSSTCPLSAAPAGYVNPLAGAVVKPERIDQGVDYAGSGTLDAIGAGRVTYLAMSGTGWPGAFVEYQLLAGADAGCSVFYAQGVTPTDGLRVGATIAAGQPVATIIPHYPTGIEVGWGAGNGTKTYAKVTGHWNATDDQDNVATAAGKSFSALIAALGGPPGKVEGP
jgi:hypothetical protein